MRKKWIAAAAAVFALSAAGCGSSSGPTLPARVTEPETETETETQAAQTEAPETAEAETAEEETGGAEGSADASAEQTAESAVSELLSPESTYVASAFSSTPEDPYGIVDVTSAEYTYDDMVSDLQELEAYYTSILRTAVIGTTHDGRNIWAFRFGNPEASEQIFICAATHGREYMTAQLVMKQLEYCCANYSSGTYTDGTAYSDLFDRTCFIVVPMVNPDGVSISQFGEEGLNREDLRANLRAIYESDLGNGYTTDQDYADYLTRWKANAMGVDLNRNYSPGWDSLNDRVNPSSSLYKGAEAGSEPESQALMGVINALPNPILAVSYHSYGNLVYWDYGQDDPLLSENKALAQHFADLTGIDLGGESNEAGFSNWCVLVRQIPSVTVEVGTQECPLPIEEFEPIWNTHSQVWAMLADLY
ncbi:MAG: M14 family zinc carboxypeptidase [Lachnospiraceae bacterium]|jgi:g-D-glutamyl-meso-diaminopimelate peptidase